MHSPEATGSGVLYLVVGASGVGKDTLLEHAKARLSATHLFARRVITRAAEAGGEDHEFASEAGFGAMAAAGAFALHWSAHGLRYGILREDTDRLREGVHVVANVSRTTIAQARERFPRVTVLHVTARAEILRDRLRMRGRESGEEIEARLARAAAAAPHGPDVVTIGNDGLLEDAVTDFVQALTMAQAAGRPTSRAQ